MNAKHLLLTATLLGALISPAAAEGPSYQLNDYWGFRGDGTGIWPADPVTTWNEMDFKKEKEGRRTKLVPVKKNPKNIVWKTSLPMHCNGGMTLAGGKLFFLNDPGGKGFLVDEKADCLGVQFFCLDAATGEVLWTRDLHHVDLVPPAQQDKLREALRAQREYNYNVFGAHLRWYRACWQRTKKEPPPPEEHKEMYRKAAGEYRKYVPAVPATLEEQRKSGKEWQAKGYVQCMFWNIEKKYLKDDKERMKYLAEYGYGRNDFVGQGSFIEHAFQTPVTDGKRIYVNTYYGDAYCLDLDGNMVWKKWYGYHQARLPSCTSPILVGDLMITAGHVMKGDSRGAHCWMAIDKATGEVVWKTPKRGGGSYTTASPSVHRLAVGGDENHTMDVLWCPSGQVLRVRDGKELASMLGSQGNARPWAFKDDVLVIRNGSSDGGGSKPQTWPRATVAFRLVAESEDKVVAETLWIDEKDHLARGITRDGIVYGFSDRDNLVARDLMTGEKIASVDLGRGQREPHHLTAIAGRYLVALDHDGTCDVVDLGEDGRTLKVVAVDNRLGLRGYKKYDFFNEGAQPALSGNRLFIRSYTDVYCIGDPSEPTRLSDEHK